MDKGGARLELGVAFPHSQCLPAAGRAGCSRGDALALMRFEKAFHVGRADVVVARAVQPLVLDDGARCEALGEPDVAAACGQVELRARERQRCRADVLLAARNHLFSGHAMLDDPQLRPALDALVIDHRAGRDGEEKNRGQSPISP